MAVKSYPFTTQQCAQAGPQPAIADRPRHFVADGASTIGDVDGAAAEGSTAAVNGTFYVMDGGTWTLAGGSSTPDADASTKGKLKLTECLAGTADAPRVVAITETGGSQILPFGMIQTGQLLQRSGDTIIGAATSAADYTNDAFWQKTYFSDRSFLPATERRNDKYIWPASDFANIGAGSQSINVNRNKVTPVNPCNFGWDIGALKSTVLFGVGGIRTRNQAGIWIGSTQPSTAANVADGSYLLIVDVTNSQIQTYKRAAGAYTAIGTTETLVQSAGLNSSVTMGVAMYYDDATNRIVIFVRMGSECWWPIIDFTDSSHTTMRYYGMWFGSATAQYLISPVFLYSS